MRKFLLLFMAMSLVTFVGCGTSDSSGVGIDEYIVTINGTDYRVSTMWGSAGGWWIDYDGIGRGDFTLSVLDDKNWIDEYDFYFISSVVPDIGDDLAYMDLELLSRYSYYKKLLYRSGSVVITGRDEYSLILKFKNLRMGDGDEEYTFDGVAMVPFDVYQPIDN